jgi:gamma-glutamyltranspeptidase
MPALAETLSAIAKEGSEVFYKVWFHHTLLNSYLHIQFQIGARC